jgi:photosystem II stability/assembly factor-like uncharacterized protein
MNAARGPRHPAALIGIAILCASAGVATGGLSVARAVVLAPHWLAVAVGDRGLILTRTDVDGAWHQRVSNTTNGFKRASFPSATVGYAAGDRGTVDKTVDGGVTWSVLTTLGTRTNLKGVSFSDDSHGCVSGEGGLILCSADGGATWTRAATGTKQVLYNIACPTVADCYAVGTGGVILASHDRGSSWIAQHSGTTGKLDAVTFTDADHGYAADDNGSILVTGNGTVAGATWQRIPPVSTHNLKGIASPGGDPTRLIAVGNGGTIVSITHGGVGPNTAQRVGGSLLGVAFADSNVGFAGGPNGLIVMTSDGGTTWAPSASGTTTEIYGLAAVSR